VYIGNMGLTEKQKKKLTVYYTKLKLKAEEEAKKHKAVKDKRKKLH